MPGIPKGEGPRGLHDEMTSGQKDRNSTPRVDIKTGGYEIDFNDPKAVEARLNQIIEQKVSAGKREVGPKMKDRWKQYFFKSVDRALRDLQTRVTEEDREITDVMKDRLKTEKIGSLKQYIEQCLKRVNPDMPNKEELRDEHFLEAAKNLKPGEKILIIAYDLDNFKLINDRRGHGVGNKVLESFGGALGSSVEESVTDSLHDALRPDDTGAHFSGDEFGALLVMPSDAPDEEIVKRIVRSAQIDTKRPSLRTGAPEGEMETQEISTGYDIVTYEEIQKSISSPDSLQELFDIKLKEADSRSLFSKSIRYVKEKSGEMVESIDRVFGPNTKIEVSKEDIQFAQALHSQMRSLSELYPEIAANSRNRLLEYASLTLEMPGMVGEHERFQKSIEKMKEILEEFQKQTVST